MVKSVRPEQEPDAVEEELPGEEAEVRGLNIRPPLWLLVEPCVEEPLKEHVEAVVQIGPSAVPAQQVKCFDEFVPVREEPVDALGNGPLERLDGVGNHHECFGLECISQPIQVIAEVTSLVRPVLKQRLLQSRKCLARSKADGIVVKIGGPPSQWRRRSLRFAVQIANQAFVLILPAVGIGEVNVDPAL